MLEVDIIICLKEITKFKKYKNNQIRSMSKEKLQHQIGQIIERIKSSLRDLEVKRLTQHKRNYYQSQINDG